MTVAGHWNENRLGFKLSALNVSYWLLLVCEIVILILMAVLKAGTHISLSTVIIVLMLVYPPLASLGAVGVNAYIVQDIVDTLDFIKMWNAWFDKPLYYPHESTLKPALGFTIVGIILGVVCLILFLVKLCKKGKDDGPTPRTGEPEP